MSHDRAPAVLSDPELTRAAVDALTDGNRSAFARLVGLADAANVRKRLAGDVRLTEIERRLYRIAIAHPTTLTRWLTESSPAA